MTPEQKHQQLNDRLDKLAVEIHEIKNIIIPISETYGTVIRLGKWAKWFLGFVLLAITTFVAIKELLKR